MFTKLVNAVSDWRLGIRANGVVPTSKQGAVHYASTVTAIFARCWTGCISPQSDSFVDIGCGKGRVLAIANTYPVGAIVGIEYEAELAAHARSRLPRLSRFGRAPPRISFMTISPQPMPSIRLKRIFLILSFVKFTTTGCGLRSEPRFG